MKKGIILAAVMSVFLIGEAQAGGPITVAPASGTSSAWASGDISLSPEGGTCGSFTRTEMITKIETNVAYWTDVSGISLTIILDTADITDDVTSCNYTDYYVDSSDDAGLTDSINPVIFDDDAEIVAELFGSGNQYVVLGFAGPDGFTSNYETMVDGQAFFNCRCLSGNPNGDCPGGITFSEDDLNFTVTHEIGHLIGLDHTQANQALAEAGCNDAVAGDCDDIPTMYPQSVDPADQISPARDDEVAILSLYGLATMNAASCTVTGSLTDARGRPLRCMDVQATTSNTADTITYVSGSNAVYTDSDSDGYSDDDGECTSSCGAFTLRGLSPSKTYTVRARPVDADWISGSSVGPCVHGQLTGVQVETLATITSGTCVAGATSAQGTISTSSCGGDISAASGCTGTTGDFDGDGDTECCSGDAAGVDGSSTLVRALTDDEDQSVEVQAGVTLARALLGTPLDNILAAATCSTSSSSSTSSSGCSFVKNTFSSQGSWVSIFLVLISLGGLYFHRKKKSCS
ncbi:MAG: hypothetical protein A3G32_07425 [Deltaproteobacteria bacterium RIFCSPLOWO2_12_FULL_40_28]|nr:MAG: hypothetical protein A3C45_07470 [Deltaproteobacteria bacterium RIFCSPHIGHO2_02_FULL_40_28]OGQ19214.1 MAG: hypothetical protein A3E27_04345 [Deltaproteobacteria bacterium RIFCSPHIGHO2_12_FULL_40_32]OGQ40562.1 MAG: hypothetical protein A3I69_00725 [Deltaproteobacteria bacterium RIFCSPLOWO2_02_FULL_40_36]OGQ53797.1 MAG: hypothetical protein A3G32_07425 [Deltaproteobacteria bacterium RIFCSPLOWO2_12_FULL_40_28]